MRGTRRSALCGILILMERPKDPLGIGDGPTMTGRSVKKIFAKSVRIGFRHRLVS